MYIAQPVSISDNNIPYFSLLRTHEAPYEIFLEAISPPVFRTLVIISTADCVKVILLD